MGKLKGKTAIVGIGEVPTGRYHERAAIVCAIESCRQAILDAGIKKDEIDFIIPTGSMYSSPYNTEMCTSRIVEELGLAIGTPTTALFKASHVILGVPV